MIPTGHPHARTFTLAAIGTLVLSLASAAPACSSNNQAPPSTSTNTTTATGGGTTTTTTTTSTTSTTTTGTGGTGGGSADGGQDSGDAAPPCVSDGGTTGCYSCPPQTNTQFLTQCPVPGDQCTSFDNATQLPFWDGGALPAVP